MEVDHAEDIEHKTEGVEMNNDVKSQSTVSGDMAQNLAEISGFATDVPAIGGINVAEEDVPKAVDGAPIIVDDAPIIVDEAPIIVDDAPTTVGDASPIIGDELAVVGDSPTIAGDPPRITGLVNEEEPMDCTVQKSKEDEANTDEKMIDEVPDGAILCWGSGEFGQNCHGAKEDQACRDGRVGVLDGAEPGRKVKFMGCGSSHTVIVTDSDDIFVWGNGNSGQLGTGNKETQWHPVCIDLYSSPGSHRPDTKPKISGIACGARHTFIWLENGHMFSFGNNYYAQLGYDVRIPNYKANQVRPHLLRTLCFRVVTQVACGERHSLFLFKDGIIGGVGSNANGQIGNGKREEALVTQYLDDPEVAVYVACGSNHSLAIDNHGQVWVWGLGKACGNKTTDLVVPKKINLAKKSQAVKVDGGNLHCMALTSTGSIYTWGVGIDGQLGHGQNVLYSEMPKKLRHPQLRKKGAQIACGDGFCAAISVDGQLYMWGRNSHTINITKPQNHKMFVPCKVESGLQSISSLTCGAWHALAVAGKPVPPSNLGEQSEDEEEKTFPVLQKQGSLVLADLDQDVEGAIDVFGHFDDPFAMPRERTSMTIAEFYAPTPTPDPKRVSGGSLLRTSVEDSPRLQRNEQHPLHNTPRDKTVQQRSHFSGAQGFLDLDDPGKEVNTDQYTSAKKELIGKQSNESKVSVENGDTVTSSKETSKKLLKKGSKQPKEEESKKTKFPAVTMPPIDNRLPPKPPQSTGVSRRRTDLLQYSRSEFNVPARSKTNIPLTQNVPRVKQYSRSSADTYFLPREDSKFSNQIMDFVPAEQLSSKGHKFIIDQHVPVHMANRPRDPVKKISGPSSSPRRPEGSPMARKPKKLQALPSNKPDRRYSDSAIDKMSYLRKTQGIIPTTPPSKDNSGPLMIPRAVSFIRGDQAFPAQPGSSPPPHPIKRHVSSIPSKQFSKYNQGYNQQFKGEQRTQKPVFSSASSWRNSRDVAVIQGKKPGALRDLSIDQTVGESRSSSMPTIVSGSPSSVPVTMSARYPSEGVLIVASQSMPSLQYGGSGGMYHSTDSPQSQTDSAQSTPTSVTGSQISIQSDTSGVTASSSTWSSSNGHKNATAIPVTQSQFN